MHALPLSNDPSFSDSNVPLPPSLRALLLTESILYAQPNTVLAFRVHRVNFLATATIAYARNHVGRGPHIYVISLDSEYLPHDCLDCSFGGR